MASSLYKKFNLDLIEDVKDMSLEYLDDGFKLVIEVGYFKGLLINNRVLYSIEYTHNGSIETVHGKNLINTELQYSIKLIGHTKFHNYTSTYNLVKRLIMAYPNERIIKPRIAKYDLY